MYPSRDFSLFNTCFKRVRGSNRPAKCAVAGRFLFFYPQNILWICIDSHWLSNRFIADSLSISTLSLKYRSHFCRETPIALECHILEVLEFQRCFVFRCFLIICSVQIESV